MIIIVPLFFVVYFAVLLAVFALLRKLGWQVKYRSVVRGGIVGYVLASISAFIVTFIVESNDAYWWYGPSWRLNALLSALAIIVLICLVGGPILASRFDAKSNV